MALGLSLRFCRPPSRRTRLLRWSEAARRGAEHGAAAAVKAAATAAERRVGPRAVPRAGHRAPRPGGRPGTHAEAALARRGGDAGGPGGGAGEGEGEEEREKGKEESRAGPPLPSPARRRPETSRAAQPSPSASPTPKVRRRSRAARRPPGRSRCCSRLAFGPRSSEPSRRHVEAAAEPAQICNSEDFFFFFFWYCGRAATLDQRPAAPAHSLLASCGFLAKTLKGLRKGRGAETQSGTRDLPAPSGQP